MFQFTDNALSILKDRYLLKDANGIIMETPEELFRRVAREVSKAESHFNSENLNGVNEWEELFFQILARGDFMPNSPTLMNAGVGSGQLSACFVLPIEKDIKTNFETLKDTTMIQLSGGGTGFNFSNLEPKSNEINESRLPDLGVPVYMKIFNSVIDQIKQGGKRRGANMGILNISHPEIVQFIQLKRYFSLSNFNISVGITDDFMMALENKEKWDLVHPTTHRIVSTIKADDLWQLILLSAWETGDPGLVFLDEINRRNPLPQLGKIEATNPCGEVPLFPYEACTLGSINLSNMIKKNKEVYEVDWNKLKQTTRLGIRFLDNTIEVNHYVVPQIKEQVLNNRKIGLGVMGWAEMLIRLKIPYDSDEAIRLAEKLMSFINETSLQTSHQLAIARGSFLNWEKSIYYPDQPMRNATRTAVAPTGTISTLVNTSFSIEPIFALVYKRQHILDGETQIEINSLFLEELEKQNMVTPDFKERIQNEPENTLLDLLDDKMKRYFRTALKVPIEYHIKHQIAFQKHTDNAVSKTINLAEDATVKDIDDAFKLAWKSGAKGITVYRYNSKSQQVLNIQESDLFCKCN